MIKVVVAFMVGLAAGYTANEFWPFGGHEVCVDTAEARVASENLDLASRLTAMFVARKTCDKKYETKLDPDNDEDLRNFMGISSTLRFGEDGLHYLTVKNSNPNFIVTKLKLKLNLSRDGWSDQTSANTGYIRVMPNSELSDIKLNTNLYGTDDLSESNFSYSIAEVWGVKVSR
ncbi:hypothetical protein [Marinobacter mangrovi]|uniref:hypothetical protein n=1 Tax=Marinobacter mangrovi TaxID=2803918 RepID=UPI001933F3C3|nr:hypothetical protein [Marinobacter mangrovi]